MKLFKSKADKKRDAFVKQALEYGSDPKRRDTLIIMGDPETDVLVAMCKGVYTAVHRKRGIDHAHVDPALTRRVEQKAADVARLINSGNEQSPILL